MDKNIGCKTVDEYIMQFTPDIQEKLQSIRKVVQDAVPGAKEKISYQMPAFDFHGILVYFAAFKNHIGFFPTAIGVEAFKPELSGYKISKGTVQLPLNEPLPLDLIRRMAEFKAVENERQEKIKKKNKKSTGE